jgi:hypothetical protein
MTLFHFSKPGVSLYFLKSLVSLTGCYNTAYDRSEKVQESASLVGEIFGTSFPSGAKGIKSVRVDVGNRGRA